ncbi:hypothetical protein DP23_4371 [Ralstonia pickettii]|nr:hypothetical protein DP23_4371 [Ralstonia pickettii]
MPCRGAFWRQPARQDLGFPLGIAQSLPWAGDHFAYCAKWRLSACRVMSIRIRSSKGNTSGCPGICRSTSNKIESYDDAGAIALAEVVERR